MREWLAAMARSLGLSSFVFAASLGFPTSLAANGEFFQFDFTPHATSVSGTIRRDRLSFSAGWSEFETGHATSLWFSYGIPLPDGVALRLGPSYRIDNLGQSDFGLRVGVERFSMNERMTLLLLGEFNTIQREYLALGQVGHLASGVAAELAFQGNNAGYREQSVAVSYRLGESPARLRLGYRFSAQRVFVGFSINTF